MKLVIKIITFALLCSSCAQVTLQADLPKIQHPTGSDRDNTIMVTTNHYRIHAQSNKTTADDMGLLLEKTYLGSLELLGAGREHPLFDVYAYADHNRYKQQLQKMGITARYASGIYTPGGVAGIYLPLVETNQAHPFFTLVHEGLHQYLHEVKGLPVEGTDIRLPAIPLWLGEGLALTLEAAVVNTNQLQPGRIHPPRLKHLQRLLRMGNAPGLESVVSKSYGAAFTNADYSMAWGMVHFLIKEKLWGSFWQAWQSAIMTEKAIFLAAYSQAALDDHLSLQTAWARHLGELSLQTVEAQIIGADGWSTWQERWQNSILQLTPQQ